MTTKAAPELVITRVFRAPRALVWKAWADPKQRLQWMGPATHPATYVEGECRTGGTFRCRLTSKENGEHLWHGGTFREVVEPEKVVYTFAWEGDDGKPENEMLITMKFAEEGPNTRISLHQIAFRDVGQRDRHNEGWTSAFDRLDHFLSREK